QTGSLQRSELTMQRGARQTRFLRDETRSGLGSTIRETHLRFHRLTVILEIRESRRRSASRDIGQMKETAEAVRCRAVRSQHPPRRGRMRGKQMLRRNQAGG